MWKAVKAFIQFVGNEVERCERCVTLPWTRWDPCSKLWVYQPFFWGLFTSWRSLRVVKDYGFDCWGLWGIWKSCLWPLFVKSPLDLSRCAGILNARQLGFLGDGGNRYLDRLSKGSCSTFVGFHNYRVDDLGNTYFNFGRVITLIIIYIFTKLSNLDVIFLRAPKSKAIIDHLTYNNYELSQPIIHHLNNKSDYKQNEIFINVPFYKINNYKSIIIERLHSEIHNYEVETNTNYYMKLILSYFIPNSLENLITNYTSLNQPRAAICQSLLVFLKCFFELDMKLYELFLKYFTLANYTRHY